MDKQNSAIAESSTNQEEFTIVFVASITTKQGKRIYARQFGKKAFPIKVNALLQQTNIFTDAPPLWGRFFITISLSL